MGRSVARKTCNEPIGQQRKVRMDDSNSKAAQEANAARALAEAEARRADLERATAPKPVEKGGRGGPDPARYNDWEVKGIATDF